MHRTNKLSSLSLLSASCLLLTLSSVKAEFQDWTREKDSATISAEIIKYDTETGKLTLKLKNDKEVVIEKSVLIAEHQNRLEEYAKEMAKHAEEMAKKREAAKNGRMETFTPEGGGGHKIHIYYPAGYIKGDESNKKRPAAYVYSPGGHSKSLVNMMKPGADELGWVLIGVDCYRNKKDSETIKKENLAAQAEAKKQVSYDTTRVVFGGFSGGGSWAFISSSFLNTEAAGILSFGGWMGNHYDLKYSKKMAVAMINGDSDKNAQHYEEPDGDFLRKKTRAKIKVFHFQGGHKLPEPKTATEAMRWVHETKEFPEKSSY
ncbi:hypothetical protein Rhal01_03640 [Rubritalea halochordaticola]|uniref:Phospholipase/carboxylesterase/thioesterase domain-containing protein n=1 Tax=Rubritalea halochordaticola TaxID=714537 RepID=A0ABP9V450_9BACT